LLKQVNSLRDACPGVIISSFDPVQETHVEIGLAKNSLCPNLLGNLDRFIKVIFRLSAGKVAGSRSLRLGFPFSFDPLLSLATVTHG